MVALERVDAAALKRLLREAFTENRPIGSINIIALSERCSQDPAVLVKILDRLTDRGANILVRHYALEGGEPEMWRELAGPNGNIRTLKEATERARGALAWSVQIEVASQQWIETQGDREMLLELSTVTLAAANERCDEPIETTHVKEDIIALARNNIQTLGELVEASWLMLEGVPELRNRAATLKRLLKLIGLDIRKAK